MRVTATAVQRGLNVYASVPVIRLTVDLGPFKDWTTGRLGAGFVGALVEKLPGLKEPNATAGWPGADVALLQGDGLSLAQVAAQVALELQGLAGADVHTARTGPAGPDGRFHVVYEYEAVSVGRAAGHLAMDLIHDLLQRALRPGGKWESDFDFNKRLKALVELGRVGHLPVQDAAVVRAARARGIEVIAVRQRIIQLGQGRSQRRMNGSKTSLTNVIGMTLTSNKTNTNRLLGELGLPVAVQRQVRSAREAVLAAEQIGYPVVIKPYRGNLGRGVTVHVTDSTEVKAAYERARLIRPTVLVEQFIPGTDYRMLVIDGSFIAASKRVPAHVVGDGVQSIEALVEAANRDPRRGNKWTALELDERAHRILDQQGLDAGNIPGPGQTAYLRDIANTSAGGTAVDVTDDVHPDNKAMATRAALMVGLDVVGVDFLTTDISRSYREVGGAICEVNSKPGLRKHMWPAHGKPRDVVGPILDMLFPPGTPATIPIAIVTGADNSVTARMLSQLLKAAGHVVGLATDAGVEVDGRSMVSGLLTPPASARTLLLDPTVDAAVLQASAEAILRHGLGLRNYLVGAVLSATGLTYPGPHSFRKSRIDALRLVLHGAQRLAVVNADEPTGLSLVDGIAAGRLCLVTTQPQLAVVVEHIAAGGTAVKATADATEMSIEIYENGSRAALLSFPATGDGAPHLANVAVAVAIAYGLGIGSDDIRDSLAPSLLEF